jgi:hypothetical protein
LRRKTIYNGRLKRQLPREDEKVGAPPNVVITPPETAAAPVITPPLAADPRRKTTAWIIGSGGVAAAAVGWSLIGIGAATGIYLTFFY